MSGNSTQPRGKSPHQGHLGAEVPQAPTASTSVQITKVPSSLRWKQASKQSMTKSQPHKTAEAQGGPQAASLPVGPALRTFQTCRTSELGGNRTEPSPEVKFPSWVFGRGGTEAQASDPSPALSPPDDAVRAGSGEICSD